MNKELPTDYPTLLKNIKSRIRTAQIKASLSVNRELVILYWEIGRIIVERQQTVGWGAGIIPRLAKDLKNEIPEIKGFSARNIGRMTAFYREYSNLPQPGANFVSSIREEGAKLESYIFNIPWRHNILLIEKVKNQNERFWYMQKTIEHGWSRNVLSMMIQSGLYHREGKTITNFDRTLPPAQSDLASQTLKDPYIFDFLTLDTDYHEKELETELVRHLEKFLIELGTGFAFVGRQYNLKIGDEDFYIDLLFYHLKLRCYIVIELKRGKFKPEYAGKMNFYLNAVDDILHHPDDNPSIGLILCQYKNRIIAEYALRNMRCGICSSL